MRLRACLGMIVLGLGGCAHIPAHLMLDVDGSIVEFKKKEPPVPRRPARAGRGGRCAGALTHRRAGPAARRRPLPAPGAQRRDRARLHRARRRGASRRAAAGGLCAAWRFDGAAGGGAARRRVAPGRAARAGDLLMTRGGGGATASRHLDRRRPDPRRCGAQANRRAAGAGTLAFACGMEADMATLILGTAGDPDRRADRRRDRLGDRPDPRPDACSRPRRGTGPGSAS